jgi:RNA polymerase sigma factor (sigma-70 family)
MSTVVASPQGTGSVSLDEYALKRIEFRVKRLARSFHLDEEHADDVRQDMALDLLKALRRFDPARCQRRTFVTRALNRTFKHIARRLRNRLRHGTKSPVSLECIRQGFEPVCNDPGQGEFSEEDLAGLRMDLEDLLPAMPERLRRVAEALMANDSPAEAARALGIHRCNVTRAIQQIRPYLEAAGYGPDRLAATNRAHTQK